MTLMDVAILGMAYIFGKRTADAEFRTCWKQIIAASTDLLGVNLTMLNRPLTREDERDLLWFIEKLRRGDADVRREAYFFNALGTQILHRAAMMN